MTLSGLGIEFQHNRVQRRFGQQGGFARRLLRAMAMPGNTVMAWLSRTMSSSASRPTCTPNLDFGMVVILSTIRRQVECKPLRAFGSMTRRNKGASVWSVVKTQIVRESVVTKLSS